MNKRKLSSLAVPVIIRGELFPSIAAAARAHNVSVPTVQGALNRGTLDNVGIGTNTQRKKPVSCNGSFYESIAQLSKEIPYSASRIRIMLSRSNGEVTLTKNGISYHIKYEKKK